MGEENGQAEPTGTPVVASIAAIRAKRAKTDSGFPEEWVPLPGIGSVLVRGLSRQETIFINKVAGNNALKVEQITIVRAILLPQGLTEEDVAEWQRVAGPGEFDDLTGKIMALSGKGPNAAKKAYMEFEDDPGAEFRPLPGGQAGHDGGDDAHGTADPAQ